MIKIIPLILLAFALSNCEGKRENLPVNKTDTTPNTIDIPKTTPVINIQTNKELVGRWYFIATKDDKNKGSHLIISQAADNRLFCSYFSNGKEYDGYLDVADTDQLKGYLRDFGVVIVVLNHHVNSDFNTISLIIENETDKCVGEFEKENIWTSDISPLTDGLYQLNEIVVNTTVLSTESLNYWAKITFIKSGSKLKISKNSEIMEAFRLLETNEFDQSQSHTGGWDATNLSANRNLLVKADSITIQITYNRLNSIESYSLVYRKTLNTDEFNLSNILIRDNTKKLGWSFIGNGFSKDEIPLYVKPDILSDKVGTVQPILVGNDANKTRENIFFIEEKLPFTFETQNINWYYIIYKNQVGWIKSDTPLRIFTSPMELYTFIYNYFV